MTDNSTISWDEANEQAAHWHARLDSGLADLEAFEEWRNADPRHAAAFARMLAAEDSFNNIGRVDLANDPDLRPPVMTRRRLLVGAGAFVTVAAGGGAWLLMAQPSRASTGIGEHRAVALKNGARVDLNTDTRVAWKEGSDARLWLERGEIALSVPAGTALTVHAAGEVVLIGGADVIIRLRNQTMDAVVVTGQLLIGRSMVTPSTNDVVTTGEGVLLGAGERRVRALTPKEIQFVSAWRQNELIFEGQTLAVAVEEYNRYLTNKIVIVDQELAAIKIGGRFKSRDPADFLNTMDSSFGIHVSRDASGSVMLSR